MSVRLIRARYFAIVGCVTAILTPGMVMGAPLVIHTGDAVQMAAGTYQFDSLTIEPGGRVLFTGSTTLNILGDVTIGHDTVITMHEDPDTHQIVTQTEDRYGQLYVGIAITGLPLSQAQGAPGAAGADGTNGSGGTLFPLDSTPGGPGGNGGSGASLGYSIVGNGNLGLDINSGGNVTINGIIHQEIFLLADNYPAASGGPGGVGGRGGNADFNSAATGNGSSGGSGGNGGSGGSGVSTKPFHIAINAAADVSVGPTGQLLYFNDFGGGANGGRGGDGGPGGFGAYRAPPAPDGGRGDGGPGGHGGQGGAGTATGDIFIQARTIAFAGSDYQPGGAGGSGNRGGHGGLIFGGGFGGRGGNGGGGGDGGAGGDGGNLIFRAGAVDFTSAPDALYQPGGSGGQGGPGGIDGGDGGIPGVPGQDSNVSGSDGSVVTNLVAQSNGVGNGGFSDGLVLYRPSGGGSSQIVDVAGNAVADMLTDAGGGPTTLTQLVTTHGNSPLRLAFDYRFLTNAGTFQVLLDNTLLATLPAVQSAVFSHFDAVLTDPALRGLDIADLNLRLLPGSVAEVQLDNVVFQPVVALPGDYNNNGIVDSADYVVWRKGLGTTYAQNDFNIWRAHFGQASGSGSGALANAAVPEPVTLALLFLAAVSFISWRRRNS